MNEARTPSSARLREEMIESRGRGVRAPILSQGIEPELGVVKAGFTTTPMIGCRHWID